MSEDVVYSEVVFVKKIQADNDPDQCHLDDLQKGGPCCDSVRLVLTALFVLATAGLIALSFQYHMKTTSNHNLEKKLQDLQEVNNELNENLTAFAAVLDDMHQRQQNISQALNNSACPKDWRYYRGKCYFFSTNTLDWPTSQDACISDGGHLVIINSKDEQEFLMSIKNKYYTSESFWIGLTDRQTESQWLWVDNTELRREIRYWSAGEPDNWKGLYGNNYNGEDCARIDLQGLNSWFDAFCNRLFRRICETRSSRQT